MLTLKFRRAIRMPERIAALNGPRKHTWKGRRRTLSSDQVILLIGLVTAVVLFAVLR